MNKILRITRLREANNNINESARAIAETLQMSDAMSVFDNVSSMPRAQQDAELFNLYQVEATAQFIAELLSRIKDMVRSHEAALDDAQHDEVYETLVRALPFQVVKNLKEAGYLHLSDIMMATDAELTAVPYVGNATLATIRHYAPKLNVELLNKPSTDENDKD